MDKTFHWFKGVLLEVLALSLPDIYKPFLVCRWKQRHNQNLGPWKRAVTYLSKKFDSVLQRWPICRYIVAAVALVDKNSDKITMDRPSCHWGSTQKHCLHPPQTAGYIMPGHCIINSSSWTHPTLNTTCLHLKPGYSAPKLGPVC